MIRTIAALLRVLLLAGLHSEHRQNPPSALQTFRTGVDIGQVDVCVLDRDRRPVRGLAAADFTILEDGQERPVVAFSAVDLPAPGDQMASVLQETSSYYVLGSQSADATLAGRARKIEVKVKRRGVRVQSRRGHGLPVDPPSTAVTDGPLSGLTDAVRDLLPKTGLEVTVTAMPFAGADRAEADVIVAVGVREPPNPSGPRSAAEPDVESMEIFTGAFDGEGRNVAWLRQSRGRQPLDRAKPGQYLSPSKPRAARKRTLGVT